MYEALMCADVHETRRPDAHFALAQIVDIAIQSEVKQVLAAGDLTDRQTNRAEPIHSWHTQLDRLETADIRFRFIEGQHDEDQPPWLSGHRWAAHAHKKTFQVGSMLGYGLNFQRWGDLQEELKKIPEDVQFLMMHQVWGDWMGDIAAPQGDFAQVPGHIKMLLSGDLHQCAIEKHKNAAGSKMTVISPGAAFQLKVDEPHEHFVILLDRSGNLTKRKLRSRPYLETELIQDEEQIETFLKEIGDLLAKTEALNGDVPAAVRKPILRVQLGHLMSGAAPRIEKAVEGKVILKFRQLPPPERVAAAKERNEARKKGEAITPLGVLAKRVNREEKPMLYDAAERLLRAQDPADEFRRWWAEQLVE